MKTGLFFGSFNPIHIGHLIIANYLMEYSDLNELWFVVTPHNPFKEKNTLLADNQRLNMVRLAVENYPKFKVSDVEFKLSKPSYTVDTLAYLAEKFPNNKFTLILGEDNLNSLPKWKNSEFLLKNYSFIIYPRITEKVKDLNIVGNITKIDAPIIELSSTKIREMIKLKKNIRPMLPPEVFEYIDGSNLYQ